MSLIKRCFPFVYTSKAVLGSKKSLLGALLNALFSANIVGSGLQKNTGVSVTKNIT